MNTHTQKKPPMRCAISRCWMCGGLLTPETENDVYSGVSVEFLVCHACDCRWYAGDRSKLASAA